MSEEEAEPAATAPGDGRDGGDESPIELAPDAKKHKLAPGMKKVNELKMRLEWLEAFVQRLSVHVENMEAKVGVQTLGKHDNDRLAKWRAGMAAGNASIFALKVEMRDALEHAKTTHATAEVEKGETSRVFSEAGVDAVAQVVSCSTCTSPCSASTFSKRQWAKGKARRCIACVAAVRAGPSSLSATTTTTTTTTTSA